jgi:DnaK suppressor protein
MTETKMGQLLGILKAKQLALEDVVGRREGIAVERSADPSDEAQHAIERELTTRALDFESGLLCDIRLALQRIDNSTYGVCQSCDGDISEKRLTALPWAKYCIKCQENIDRAPERQDEVFAAS